VASEVAEALMPAHIAQRKSRGCGELTFPLPVISLRAWLKAAMTLVASQK
jgi:hypothetical protein